MYGLAWTKHLTTNAVSLIEENRKKRHERRKRESERDGVHERAGRMSEKKESKQKLRKKKKKWEFEPGGSLFTYCAISNMLVQGQLIPRTAAYQWGALVHKASRTLWIQ